MNETALIIVLIIATIVLCLLWDKIMRVARRMKWCVKENILDTDYDGSDVDQEEARTEKAKDFNQSRKSARQDPQAPAVTVTQASSAADIAPYVDRRFTGHSRK